MHNHPVVFFLDYDDDDDITTEPSKLHFPLLYMSLRCRRKVIVFVFRVIITAPVDNCLSNVLTRARELISFSSRRNSR